jgi:hypothetical protein
MPAVPMTPAAPPLSGCSGVIDPHAATRAIGSNAANRPTILKRFMFSDPTVPCD